MRGNVCVAVGGRNCEIRDNARYWGLPMSRRALCWSAGLMLGYLAFLTLLTAVGAGWHL